MICYLFREKWTEFEAKYSTDYWFALEYFRHDLLETWMEQVLKCYTNDLTHFGNTTTLRVEGGHAKIKRQLNNTSTGKIT